MKKRIIALFAFYGLLATGCSDDERLDPQGSGTAVSARLEVAGSKEYLPEQDAQIATVQGFRFEQEVLAEIITSFQTGTDGSYTFYPKRTEGDLCLLANGGRLKALQELTPGITTKAEFLAISADRETFVTDEGQVAMSGWMELGTASAGTMKVSLVRSVARIDLSSLDEGVEVNRITVTGLPTRGYLHEQEEVKNPVGSQTHDFEKEFTRFSNRSECLLYLPEQTRTKIEAEIIATFDGARHRLVTSLPAVIRRNRIYTLAVYGRGSNLSVTVKDDDWEEGARAESAPLVKGMVDVQASELSEGVRVNATRDTVFIPYLGSQSRLALLGEAGTDVTVEGQVRGVQVTPGVASKGLQPIAQVSISSEHRMPGTQEEYLYLNIHRQQEHSGRVVLVIESSPIILEGLIRLDEEGVCDFDRYLEGELGRLTLPAGKIASVEFDEGVSPWMQLSPDAGSFRILGGWKPNDPEADGRKQEGRLVISDADGRNREAYTIRRRNWGLPVVNIDGTWWCKYNLRGNVKSFSDQVSIAADRAAGDDLAGYLNRCSETELLRLLGHQYQAGYPDGYPLKHNGTAFYHEGMRGSGENFGLTDPEEMAPEGYRIPEYDDYAFFSKNTNFNLGGQGSRTYQNEAGQEITVTITEREVSFEGQPYGIIAFYDFRFGEDHWVLCGLGHQWNTTPGNIARMSLLMATYGHSSNTWVMEGYAHNEKPNENWLKYVPQNNQKTRTIRCIKKPVEYIYE